MLQVFVNYIASAHFKQTISVTSNKTFKRKEDVFTARFF